MRNNSFNKLEKADKMVDSFLKVAISLDLICALLLLIGGILVCALVDVGTGIGYNYFCAYYVRVWCIPCLFIAFPVDCFC